MSAPFDLYDQAVLTDLIVRPLTTEWEDQPLLGEEIAPMLEIQSRVAKLRKASVLSFGLGQFKAPGASPRLYKSDQTWREELIELVLLEEMERIDDETWLRLNSSDENVRRAAGVDLVTRGQILELRNRRLSEWMRWEAFSGDMVVSYEADSQDLFIDYGFPAGHKPTVATGWDTVATADPISDLRAFSNQIADSSGYFGTTFHMSSNTYDYIVRNAKVRDYLTASNRSMLIPTLQDILTLLRDGTNIVIYDNGYRPVSAGDSRGIPGDLTRFLPDLVVLATTDYSIEGLPIAQTLDGQTLVGDGYNSVAIRQGPQSEVILDPMSKNHFFRQASSRMVRVNYPECFLYADVS